MSHMEADKLGHNYVSCDHLLLAILMVDAGASRLLLESGIYYGATREKLFPSLNPEPFSPDLFGVVTCFQYE